MNKGKKDGMKDSERESIKKASTHNQKASTHNQKASTHNQKASTHNQIASTHNQEEKLYTYPGSRPSFSVSNLIVLGNYYNPVAACFDTIVLYLTKEEHLDHKLSLSLCDDDCSLLLHSQTTESERAMEKSIEKVTVESERKENRDQRLESGANGSILGTWEYTGNRDQRLEPGSQWEYTGNSGADVLTFLSLPSALV